MSKTITLTHQGGLRFLAKYGRHEVMFDLGEEKGGTDQGMTPGELMCASLGACTAITVARYCQTAGVPVDGMTVQATYEGDRENTRAERFEIKIAMPDGASGREKAIKKAGETCYVKSTLLNVPKVEVKIDV